MSGEFCSRRLAGINILHVPYRGLAAGGYADLMTGIVHVTFDNLPPSIETDTRRQATRARGNLDDALGGSCRSFRLGGCFLPGYEGERVVMASPRPPARPLSLSRGLNQELKAAFADPKMKAAGLPNSVVRRCPALARRFRQVFRERGPRKWAKVVKLSGAKAD